MASTTADSETPVFHIGTRDKRAGWYTPTLENVTPAQRDLLEKYSHLSSDRVIPHILEVRDRAWEIHPYPCIGELRFIDLSMMNTPSYPQVLQRLKDGASLLDLGCCFAQDLRKLVHDGAPATNLWGAELEQEFINLGYELFLDKETFGGHFMQADVFDMEGPLKQLDGKLDMVQVGLFLHLFSWEGQVTACKRIVGLMKPKTGTLIIGQQIGVLEAKEVTVAGGKRVMFKHNVESFEKMWKEVGEKTGTEWQVRASMDGGLGITEKGRAWDDPTTRRLSFEVERIK
ncbi:Uncharacterized protein BP5553_00124 [Venustampulla echinocandica]|uniref:Methyltransferase domain-containing protein n=1 Tax=Venustampulla echinocandica TaxID=2656787 RepID=A0A370TX88_9HELO|nr:Uncharacterized protein BP5553_00124 [Venustampulla echinocandica]RDL40145.1 Uncharacterized protein BP5553_00124 [Venustampulla echinocandica]